MEFTLLDWQLRRENAVSIGPFDLRLQAGEILTVMGPSGIGKTTLLMSLLGYQETGLTIGGERRLGETVLAPGEIPRNALYIPQRSPFNPNWEVRGFLHRLPWGQKKLTDTLRPSHSLRFQQIQATLKELGLAHRARATVGELSGGEIQRAALAQMLLLKPSLLVGDEFVSALDPGMTVWILERCRQEIQNNQGVALLALHDVQAALRVSDRILLLWPAEVTTIPWEIQVGTPLWQGNVLHAFLCLARWAKDFSNINSLKYLLNSTRSLFEDGDRLEQFLTINKKYRSLTYLGNNEIIYENINYRDAQESAYENGDSKDTTPFNSHGGVGLAIPRGRLAPLQLIAQGQQDHF